MRTLRIGTRGSDLALCQANFIRKYLSERHSTDTTLKIIKTSGDKIDDLPFEKMEGKGFFTKELEDALLSGEIDLAVHSLKDLMTLPPDGLTIAGIGARVDRRELLLFHKNAGGESGFLPLKAGSSIGAGSARRRSQIRHYNPLLEIKPIRGNVPTRVRKLREHEFDSIIIAAAGVDRLELDVSDLGAIRLDPRVFLPAPAQGVLGVQTRTDDTDVIELFSDFGTETEKTETRLERGLLGKFDAGCSLPLGVFSQVENGERRLLATLGPVEALGVTQFRTAEARGNEPGALVNEVFESLTKRG